MQWRAPVSKLLPDDFVLSDPYLTANITVEDILSHRTGDPGHDDALHGQKAAQPDNAKSITRNLINLPFNKPLRTDYQYSNLMYTVATHLIETVTGNSYSDFVKKRIWEPLGMSNTYHDVTGVEAGNAKTRLAMGYGWDKENQRYFSIPSYAQPEGHGAGCVFSSVSDYSKWVRALIQRSGPLSKAAHEELVKGRIVIPYEGNDVLPLYGHSLYALGVIVESYRGHVLVGHDGSFHGFKALMRFLPDQDWGIVMFGNSNNAFYVLQILFHQLMDEVLNIPETERTDWPGYWRKCLVDGEKEEAEDDSQPGPPGSPETLPVTLEGLAGEYFNAGYRTLLLCQNEDKLEADCTDRGMPFKLKFDHLSGNQFAVEYYDLLDRSTRKRKAEFDVTEDGVVQSLGISLCDEMKDELIWFQKLISS